MRRREFLSIAGAAPIAAAAADSAWLDITRFGAVAGEHARENAAAIQKAIDTCAAAGGGTVRIPPGRFRSAQLRLKSGVALWLDHGADLVASPDPAHYDARTPVSQTPRDAWGSVFLLAERATTVAILGAGTIRGAGLAKPRVPNTPGAALAPFRPRLVAFEGCRDVRVDGITLLDADRWTLHFYQSDEIRCTGLRIRAAYDILNTDGIDVDGCRHVTIAGCDIACGDDCIVLKTTNYLSAARPMEMVTVANCVLRTRASALKIGTETHADISDITFTNCVIAGEGEFRPTNAVAIECVDGGRLRAVSVSNITAKHVQAPVFVRLGDRSRGGVPTTYATSAAPASAAAAASPSTPAQSAGTTSQTTARSSTAATPASVATGPSQAAQSETSTSSAALPPNVPCGSLADVIVQNLVAYDATVTSSVTGVPARSASSVVLSDLRITMAGGGTADLVTRAVPEREAAYPDGKMFGPLPAHGLYARHVVGLTLRNIDIACEQPDARPVAIVDDVQKLHVEGLRKDGVPIEVGK